jgi:hypothetical protein
MDNREGHDARHTLTRRNRITGGVMALIGLYVVLEASSFELGSAVRMGPGFLPLGLGILIIVFAVLIAIINDDGDQPASKIVWRPVVFVLTSILSFALLIEPVGLLAATAALVFISGAADPEHTWRSLSVLYVILIVAVYVVFVMFLSVPFKLITGII